MKSVIKANRSAVVASAMATLAVAAMGFAGSAQARDNVYWSVGVGTPGAVVNVGNVGSVYQQPQPVYIQPQPVYVQPHPVYVQPHPVYVQPAPVYYQQRPLFVQPQAVYGVPQPVYYGRPHGWKKHHRGYAQGPGYYRDGQGYGPMHHQRRDRNHGRDDD